MPKREFQTAAEFQPAMAGASIILIEVTERDQPRPLDPDRQKEMYSGKKKTASVEKYGYQ